MLEELTRGLALAFLRFVHQRHAGLFHVFQVQIVHAQHVAQVYIIVMDGETSTLDD